MLWIVLMAGALVAAVFINHSMARWFARGLSQLKRREAALALQLRRKRRELEKATRSLSELRETEGSFARLMADNEYAKQTDPGEWLLQNKHITLSLYLKAKTLAQRRGIEIVDACVELGAIDTKLAREAVNATAPVTPRSKSGRGRAESGQKNGQTGTLMGTPMGGPASGPSPEQAADGAAAPQGAGEQPLSGRSTS